jgi:hypothetical protein
MQKYVSLPVHVQAVMLTNKQEGGQDHQLTQAVKPLLTHNSGKGTAGKAK